MYGSDNRSTAISGHLSEVSLVDYNAYPMSDELKTCSDILSE